MSSGVANYDHTGAAAIYSSSNVVSWAQALLLPAAQAVEKIGILKYQANEWEKIDNKQKATIDKALVGYFDCIDSLLPSYKDAYPDVPEAARYVPVDPCSVQSETIECNIGLIARANDWAQCVNRLHEQNDLTRLVVLDPRALVNQDLNSIAIQDLLRGKHSTGDMMEVMTDTGEGSCMNGTMGGCAASTTRNIGGSVQRFQATGRAELRAQIGMFEQISPSTRRADIREMMSTPQQRITFALQQAQIIQNDLQNYFNQQAQKPPHRMAELQTRLERCINKLQWEGAKASLSNQHVPNYAAVLGPEMGSLNNAIGGALGGGGGAAPNVTQSTYDAPSVGGNYQKQNSADASSKSGMNIYD